MAPAWLNNTPFGNIVVDPVGALLKTLVALVPKSCGFIGTECFAPPYFSRSNPAIVSR